MEKKVSFHPSEIRNLPTSSEVLRKEVAKKLIESLLKFQTKLDFLEAEALKSDDKRHQADKSIIERVKREMSQIVDQIREGGSEFQKEILLQTNKSLNEFTRRPLEQGARTRFDIQHNEKQIQRWEAIKEFLEKHLGTEQEP